MLEVQIEYKSCIIHTAHFQILVMCTNYAIIIVTYDNKSVTDNTVNSVLCFYTEPCPDTWQCITDKYRFSSPAIWWYINILFYFASVIRCLSYAAASV